MCRVELKVYVSCCSLNASGVFNVPCGVERQTRGWRPACQRLFLMCRVELKGRDRFKSITEEGVFLMCRVELKGSCRGGR